MTSTVMKTGQGIAMPLGSSIVHRSLQPNLLDVNFAVFARVSSLTLLLFPPLTSSGPVRDPFAQLKFQSRTGDVWHMLVHELHPDVTYALATTNAPHRILSDPYARWIESAGCDKWMTVEGEDFNSSNGHQDPAENAIAFLKSFPLLNGMQIRYPFQTCRFTAPESSRCFNWNGEASPNLSYEDLIIYEAHVRALSSEGTFAAACTAIPYLKWLGVSALQLMPVFEFNEIEMGALNGDYKLLSDDRFRGRAPVERPGNWWGYSPISWFSPMNRYAKRTGGGSAELKALVKELHNNGIECFLDVVYNHSANASFPLHFLNVQRDYYIGKMNGHTLEHSNISGCGNTLSPNSTLMKDVILDSMRWFVTEYRIDGFRIDAAGVLCRDQNGTPISKPEVINDICSDPVLKNTKLIVEGWDAGDQIGSPNMLLGSKHGFPSGDRICEWNVEWRDAVRRFFRGDKQAAKPFCEALRGSPRLFGDGKKLSMDRPLGAHHGINFVACHDGFSMADVVSYRKRKNRDGYGEISFNCGTEGDTLDPWILSKRAQQLKNFIFALAISRGVPMISQGDEFGFSKEGNSNTWNDPGLFAARLSQSPQTDDSFEGLLSFTKKMFEVRMQHKMIKAADFFSQLSWLDERGNPRTPRHGGSSKSIVGYVAFSVHTAKNEPLLFIAINGSKQDVPASLPNTRRSNAHWRKVIDTGSSTPSTPTVESRVANDNGITVSRQACVLYERS